MSNNLTHELLKNCTSLVKLSHLNDLCSNLNNKSCNVYGLRAEFGYPEHLIPPIIKIISLTWEFQRKN